MIYYYITSFLNRTNIRPAATCGQRIPLLPAWLQAFQPARAQQPKDNLMAVLWLLQRMA
jgi:hypothetical protein